MSHESYVDLDEVAALTARTPENILAVARAHGTPPAAEWAGRSRAWVVNLRREVDGYDRGRGHPTLAELEARKPRRDCGCGMCIEWRSAEMKRSNKAWSGTQPLELDLSALVRPGEWAEQGACRGADTEVFFTGPSESTAPAKAVCAGCTVRVQCLDFALELNIDHGVWGGLSARERRRVRRSRRSAPATAA